VKTAARTKRVSVGSAMSRTIVSAAIAVLVQQKSVKKVLTAQDAFLVTTVKVVFATLRDCATHSLVKPRELVRTAATKTALPCY